MKLSIFCTFLALSAFTAPTGSSPSGLGQGTEQGTEQAQDQPAWPRTFESETATISLHQPQPESFEGNDLTARAVVGVTLKGTEEPVFGTVWLQARVETDRSERMVYIRSVTVPKVRFPDATVQQEATLSQLLEAQIMSWDVQISLDRLLTSLEHVQQELQAAEGLETAPPGSSTPPDRPCWSASTGRPS